MMALLPILDRDALLLMLISLILPRDFSLNVVEELVNFYMAATIFQYLWKLLQSLIEVVLCFPLNILRIT